MTIAYFDCFSGISGDMTLGALLDLGVPVDWLKAELEKLSISAFDIVADNVSCNGIQAVRAKVIYENDHQHRDFDFIQKLINNSPFSEKVKQNSLKVFDCIAEAEARIHGCEKQKVHFHEVGALDALVDIAGTCLGLEYLNIDTLICSALPLGKGFVESQHGTLPVPAPATLEILKGLPVYGGRQSKEIVTPTGAAIVAALGRFAESMPYMRIEKTGYGSGTYLLKDQPNLLRIILGKNAQPCSTGNLGKLVKIETAIDDMNPEIFGYLMDKLLNQGALDVFWTPVHMKKSRPGTLVSVLCGLDKRDELSRLIMAETTTLGVRYHDVYRTSLNRRCVEVQTRFGPVRVKEAELLNGSTRRTPEFEDCKRIAEKNDIALQEVYDLVRKSKAICN
ncbi:MAG: nickel pincer cofactor biosynthesis protein LarC [Desulfobacteraceae bacterium]|nr:nickel pincer cofactor biosynthesis protein LarC [Desulfobacteraceae bacterium]